MFEEIRCVTLRALKGGGTYEVLVFMPFEEGNPSNTLSAGLLLVSLSSFAQGNAGRIAGAITDQTGGAMAGATVTVTDVQRGVPVQ